MRRRKHKTYAAPSLQRDKTGRVQREVVKESELRSRFKGIITNRDSIILSRAAAARLARLSKQKREGG